MKKMKMMTINDEDNTEEIPVENFGFKFGRKAAKKVYKERKQPLLKCWTR